MQYIFFPRLSYSRKTKVISQRSADHTFENRRLGLVHSQLLHSQQEIKIDTTLRKTEFKVWTTQGRLRIMMHIPLQFKLMCFRRLLINRPLRSIAIHNQCWNCECIIHLHLTVAVHLPTHSTNTNKEFTAELKKKNTFILHATS